MDIDFGQLFSGGSFQGYLDFVNNLMSGGSCTSNGEQVPCETIAPIFAVMMPFLFVLYLISLAFGGMFGG